MFIQSRMVSSESHNVGLRTSSVPSAKSTLSLIGHSGSFNVILNAVGRNPERGVDLKYNNVVSETYEEIAPGKLQIRRFQPPHSGLTTVVREKPSSIYK